MTEDSTAQEIYQLSLCGDGMSAAAVAAMTHRAESTIWDYRKNIRRKMGTHTMTEAFARAWRSGLVP